MAEFTIEEITRIKDLVRLTEEWSALCDICPSATIFQTPEWLIPWWKHLGGAGLWTLALWRQSRLAALAPFFIWESGLRQRQLLFIGTGISDYLDVLIDPRAGKAALNAIIHHLAGNGRLFDLCLLQELRPESPLLAAGGGLEPFAVEIGACPVLKLPGSAGDFLETLPPRLRRILNRSRKRAEGSIERADSGNLEEIIGALFRVHRLEWSRRNSKGMLADPGIRNFHRQAAESMLEKKRLRLYGLRLNGAVEAALHCFDYKNSVFSYLSGFNPELRKSSPGSILIAHGIREAIRDGMKEFDFLRGREAYKYSWGARDRKSYQLSFTPADLRKSTAGRFNHSGSR